MTDSRIESNALTQWTQTLLKKCGCSDEEAERVAKNLVWNSQIDRDQHGLSRLEVLLERLEKGLITPACQLEFRAAGSSLAHCDGNNGLGQYIGHKAMERAIALAGEHGIGGLSVSNSNWNGSGAYYVQLAAQAEMIGFCFSNSLAKVPAYQGEQAVFGTNPLAFASPHPHGKSILIDMATSNWCGASVRDAENQSVPIPSDALQPLGGAKGYGLAFIVEILSALLSGAGLSKEVTSLFSHVDSGQRSGQFFLAIDIKKLLPLQDYFQRLNMLLAFISASGGHESPRLPGEKRWKSMDESLKYGVRLPKKTAESLQRISHIYQLPITHI